jgi:prepilin-type N-terminal cleavage/methylation domain-containing protein
MIRRFRSDRGYTLLEVVLAVVLMAILFPPLIQWLGGMAVTGAKVDRLPTAVQLGSELLEEIKSRKFDELSAKVSGSWSTVLGPDAGESSTNKNDFDDVDDFNGWAQNFASPYTGYSATVTMSYVLSSAPNTPLTIPSPVPTGWTPSYKRVVVTISNATLPAPLPLTTIVTEVQSL